MKLSYSEYQLIEEIIDENPSLGSFRAGYLNWLDEANTKFDVTLSESTDRLVDVSEVEIDISIPTNISTFLFNKLQETVVYNLLTKLETVE